MLLFFYCMVSVVKYFISSAFDGKARSGGCCGSGSGGGGDMGGVDVVVEEVAIEVVVEATDVDKHNRQDKDWK